MNKNFFMLQGLDTQKGLRDTSSKLNEINTKFNLIKDEAIQNELQQLRDAGMLSDYSCVSQKLLFL